MPWRAEGRGRGQSTRCGHDARACPPIFQSAGASAYLKHLAWMRSAYTKLSHQPYPAVQRPRPVCVTHWCAAVPGMGCACRGVGEDGGRLWRVCAEKTVAMSFSLRDAGCGARGQHVCVQAAPPASPRWPASGTRTHVHVATLLPHTLVSVLPSGSSAGQGRARACSVYNNIDRRPLALCVLPLTSGCRLDCMNVHVHIQVADSDCMNVHVHIMHVILTILINTAYTSSSGLSLIIYQTNRSGDDHA